ncbi:alpha/beta hydrolase [Bradyrhizobium manausense]|uniref:alpha/beta fold hydrolase n=1 Tax=Bradyrhizobium TaxID=374 RepID=UPI001BAA347B|nr:MULTISPECIES: alpha/beta hydrolase [Bradyrhizobium]MBR0829149.1 alpha/beta hydrolase [Bradyrhizobium manausense]UVO29927.1 alpha/beta hydrolase [Bradyrhizobium arachidis]
MSQPTQRTIKANGISLNVAEQGTGPLVLLCHGFPEGWYSWRHQLEALAAAGFHAVAPDMRGYGKSDKPEAIDQYTIFHMVGDLIGVLDALEAKDAVIVGHDWGAGIAWHAARLRPDRFRAAAILSVPYRPRSPVPPTSVMPQTTDAQFYQLYFQEPGVAEAEFEKDPRKTLAAMLFGGSGEGVTAIRAMAAASGKPSSGVGMVSRSAGMLPKVEVPLPSWLSAADLDYYAAEFARSGFRGPLNYYRNIDRNWELMAAFEGVKVVVPTLFIAGDHDMVIAFPGAAEHLANMKQSVPQLREIKMLPGCGHWTQQERPKEVNAALVEFLRSLPN